MTSGTSRAAGADTLSRSEMTDIDILIEIVCLERSSSDEEVAYCVHKSEITIG